MSPVSPVVHTEATVSIGLKTYSEWEHPFYNIRFPCCEAEHAKTFISIVHLIFFDFGPWGVDS